MPGRKVLDFGLAKAMHRASGVGPLAADVMNSPTFITISIWCRTVATRTVAARTGSVGATNTITGATPTFFLWQRDNLNDVGRSSQGRVSAFDSVTADRFYPLAAKGRPTLSTPECDGGRFARP